MKPVNPTPRGARNVALCLTQPSIMYVKTNIAVRNISMKKPWTMVVSALSLVPTLRGPGYMAMTTAAAAMAATN